MLEDKAKIADIASHVYRFAKGRKNESKAQKFLMGQYFVLGGITTAAALVFKIPLLLLAWVPHTLMTFVISKLATVSRPYASNKPPIFKSDNKILKETQSYLEHLEFSEYKSSLNPNVVVANSYSENNETRYWYQSLLKTQPC